MDIRKKWDAISHCKLWLQEAFLDSSEISFEGFEKSTM